ncbi:MAG: hypothetical protein K6C36_10395 [Clostridia bacterium]|nr:hypothetical protein [Clostridia bacterium]
MLTFIHTYAPDVFPALLKSSLWRGGDGLKLMHKPDFAPPFDFNTAAAPGGALDTLLNELRCPFYIDRLQGGLGYPKNYPYDETLLDRLKMTLGENFWGFQMHEWASNLCSDEKRIAELFDREGKDPRDPEERNRVWDRVVSAELPLYLEAYPAEDWRNMPLSDGPESFTKAAEALYARRAKETGGLLFPADSYLMAPRTELAFGAKRLMPEVGWQIPNMRAQLALTRGAARSAGVPWGIYYECWQDTKDFGFTIPFSLGEVQDEWNEDLFRRANGAELPLSRRELGGSSLSLLRRAWRLAYFSGAEYIAEEYGVCNTFRSLITAELSPYGEEKRDFLRFAEKFPDPGVPFVPVAVVLPADVPMFDVTFGDCYPGYMFSYLPESAAANAERAFRETMAAVFGTAGKNGNMGHVIKNGGLPGAVDIVYEDSPALSRYDMLIDPTGDPTFAQRHPNAVTVEEADRRLDGLLPCRFGGGLFAAYNRTTDGWLVLVMNNDGVFHDGFMPDVKLPEAAVTAFIEQAAPGAQVTMAAGDGILSESGGKYAVTLGAGEWLLLSIR